MLLMRKPKRHALKALYYFCRAVDDAVDEVSSKEEARQNLAYWRGEIENLFVTKNSPENEISSQLGIAIWRYQLPRQPFEDLLNGMEFDCSTKVEIHTEQELERYCYCVAGSVGLLAMRIFGVQGADAEQFAIYLGQALQLTNILRDRRKDKHLNRSYVPAQWGNSSTSKLIAKTDASFQKVARIKKQLPTRPLIPAILMRDIYYRKFTRLKKT